mgnify:CR=1 FL=1
MLQTSFSKLKKHHPTRLYMIYPMVQSVARFGVEIDKKMASQGGIVHGHHHPKTKSHFASLNFLNFEYVTHACPAFTPQH